MRLDVSFAADAGSTSGSRGYPIEIVSDLPGVPTAALLREVLSPRARRLLIVSDDNVAPLYASGLATALRDAGYDPATIVVPAGEASKRLAIVEQVLDAGFAHKLSRSEAFVALGGGVVGDVTGFAASIYQRGIDVVQVPTTLLAQVDSSVGGKTGVNHASGKNLVGAFWQPRAVIASQAVLRTLPARELRCGLAEAVKHAFIADPSLLADIARDSEALMATDPGTTARLVHACCRIKAAVVAEDPREDPISGRRAVLNFGHTFGHAYEKLLGYGGWTHGEAVAVGMVWAARLSERLGVAGAGLEADVRDALAGLGLPCDPDDPELPALPALIEAARGDKKGDAAEVRFVLLTRIGDALIKRLAWDDMQRSLAECRIAFGCRCRRSPLMQTKTYAEILARQGEFEPAMEIYRKLIAKKPGDDGLRKRLAEIEALAAGLLLGAPPPKPKPAAQGRLEAFLHRIQSRRRR